MVQLLRVMRILEYGIIEYGICDALVSSTKLGLYNMDAVDAIIKVVANKWRLWK